MPALESAFRLRFPAHGTSAGAAICFKGEIFFVRRVASKFRPAILLFLVGEQTAFRRRHVSGLALAVILHDQIQMFLSNF